MSEPGGGNRMIDNSGNVKRSNAPSHRPLFCYRKGWEGNGLWPVIYYSQISEWDDARIVQSHPLSPEEAKVLNLKELMGRYPPTPENVAKYPAKKEQ